MILIGQYDSPFVRRVGVALVLYDLAFEHRPWSTFGDAEKIRPFNPLVRVPTLVLDDGDVLIESHSIIDHLDRLVPAGQAMFPADEPERHRALKLAALATGLSDKAVTLFYEQKLHAAVSEMWVERCVAQIKGVLSALETERAARQGDFLSGGRIGHADIALACALRHLAEAHPALFTPSAYPALAAHSARLEAMPVFQTISQRFIPPA